MSPLSGQQFAFVRTPPKVNVRSTKAVTRRNQRRPHLRSANVRKDKKKTLNLRWHALAALLKPRGRIAT
ncbi:MAG: hypothetical protein ACTS68_01465 [Candidatus Hodgkinia cicadicola]